MAAATALTETTERTGTTERALGSPREWWTGPSSNLHPDPGPTPNLALTLTVALTLTITLTLTPTLTLALTLTYTRPPPPTRWVQSWRVQWRAG